MELIVCKRCNVVHAYKIREGAPRKCSNCGLKEAKSEHAGVRMDWYGEVDIDD